VGKNGVMPPIGLGVGDSKNIKEEKKEEKRYVPSV
jgi:hypothetical protein